MFHTIKRLLVHAFLTGMIVFFVLIPGFKGSCAETAVLTTPVIAIQSTTSGTGYVNIVCTVVSNGGYTLTACGMQIRPVGSSWIDVNGTFNTGKTSFQATKSGLTSRTIYEVRGLVKYVDSYGHSQTVYTAEIRQVMTPGPAGLKDLTVVSTTTTAATFSVNVYDDGNDPPIMKVEFIVYSYPDNVEVTRISKYSTTGYPTGVHTLTTYDKLTPNTEYQVTAWVTNGFSPVSLGPVRFKTPPLPPAVTTSTILITIPSGTKFNATMRGEVTSDNGSAVTERGFVYGTSATPTLANSTKVTMGTGTGIFNATASGLSYSVKYYYRAYAKNAGGTSYGAIRTIYKTPTATPTATPSTATASPTPVSSSSSAILPTATKTASVLPTSSAITSPTGTPSSSATALATALETQTISDSDPPASQLADAEPSETGQVLSTAAPSSGQPSSTLGIVAGAAVAAAGAAGFVFIRKRKR